MEILDFFYMSWELGELSQRVLTKLQAGQLQNHGLIPRRGKILLSKMSRPVLGRAQPPVLFVLGKVAKGMKLTTHVHLVPRLRMSGAVPLLPHMAK
jgi:hypothetical protein